MTKLCALCSKQLTGFEERMEYGMPYYKKGDAAVGIASQKNYISIYGLRRQVAESGVELAGAKEGQELPQLPEARGDRSEADRAAARREEEAA